MQRFYLEQEYKGQQMTDLDKLDKNEKEFIMYQEAFYNILRKFYREGDKLMKKGPSAVTETVGYIDSLLFLLLWQIIKDKHDKLELDIIRDLFMSILEGDSPLGEMSKLNTHPRMNIPKDKLN